MKHLGALQVDGMDLGALQSTPVAATGKLSGSFSLLGVGF